MNTLTLDAGVKRQFVLPAAIVLGAYAALFFGFVRHPPISLLSPLRQHEPPSLPVDLTRSELPMAKSSGPVPSRPLQPRQPDVPDPISPVRSGVQVEIPMRPMSPTAPVSPVIGPWSQGDSTGYGDGPGPQVLDPALLDHPPQVVAQVQPDYPYDARETGENGNVVVAFVVDESGRVLHARVVSSSDPIFEEPTLRAIAQWRFAPGTWHGAPVRFRLSVPVAFHLEG